MFSIINMIKHTNNPKDVECFYIGKTIKNSYYSKKEKELIDTGAKFYTTFGNINKNGKIEYAK